MKIVNKYYYVSFTSNKKNGFDYLTIFASNSELAKDKALDELTRRLGKNKFTIHGATEGGQTESDEYDLKIN